MGKQMEPSANSAPLTWTATRIPVMSICERGLIKLGLFADLRAQLKMREMRFVLTKSEAYMSAKPKFTCKVSRQVKR